MPSLQGIIGIVLVGLTVACTLTGAPATTTPLAATATASAAPTDTRASATEPPATATVSPEEPIDIPEELFIQSPRSGSRVASPLTVSGQADPTFEQTLLARLFLLDGTELASGPIHIDAPLGERGPYQGELEFQVDSEQQAVLQVLTTSARDGGLTHLSSVIITLVPPGAGDNVTSAEPHRERIIIENPQPGAEISGGQIRVSGVGLPSFEGTLVVSLIGPDGELMAEEPLIVDAPDMGEYGTFEITISYNVAEQTPARVLVTDPSPAFDGYNHANSVEVRLNP